MAIFLLDTTVIIDAIKGKRGRNQLLDDLLAQHNLLACCSINVTEIYAGMRTHEAPAKKGYTLFLPDVTISAVAITHRLPVLTDNRKDFPCPNCTFIRFPIPPYNRHAPSPRMQCVRYTNRIWKQFT